LRGFIDLRLNGWQKVRRVNLRQLRLLLGPGTCREYAGGNPYWQPRPHGTSEAEAQAESELTFVNPLPREIRNTRNPHEIPLVYNPAS
jgi:hypothetical protein